MNSSNTNVNSTTVAVGTDAKNVNAVGASNTASQSKKVNSVFKIKRIDATYQYMKLLVYGNSGTGKTTLAASSVDVESMRDILFINIEGGTLALNNNIRVKNKDLIDVIDVNKFRVIVDIQNFLAIHLNMWSNIDNGDDVEASMERIKTLEEKVTGVPASEITNPKRYRTVIIDSITEVEKLCMNSVLGIPITNDLYQIDDSMKVAEFKEYKQNFAIMNQVLRAYRDLKMNIICICAQKYSKDEIGKLYYQPALIGELRQSCQGIFDIVGYLQAAKANSQLAGDEDIELARRLHVVPTNQWDAKSRISRFTKPFFKDPVMSDLMSAVGLIESTQVTDSQ